MYIHIYKVLEVKYHISIYIYIHIILDISLILQLIIICDFLIDLLLSLFPHSMATKCMEFSSLIERLCSSHQPLG